MSAGEFLNSVRMLPEIGPHLADIVTAFGNVALSYLKYKTSKNETGTSPHQAIRIEPYESFELRGEADKILKALLRYSIFLGNYSGTRYCVFIVQKRTKTGYFPTNITPGES